MTQHFNRIVLFTIFLCSCETIVPLESIPKTEEEFQLSPQQLSDRFADVKKYQLGVKRESKGIPDLKEIEKHWGSADEIKLNRVEKYYRMGSIVAWIGSALPESLLVTIPLFAGLDLFDVGAFYYDGYWQKGNYKVKSTFFGTKEKLKLVGWDWYHIDEPGRSIFEKKNRTRVFLSWDYGLNLNYRFADQDFDYGSLYNVGINVYREDLFTRTGIIVSGMYGNEVRRNSVGRYVQTTRYVLEFMPLIHIYERLNVGLGIQFIPSTSLDFNYRNDIELNPGFGLSIAFFYITPASNIAPILRYEYITQTANSGLKYESLNVSIRIPIIQF